MNTKIRAIPLKRWALCCYGQIAVALIMGALGMIDQHTVMPACYFGFVNIVVGVIASEKKSNGPSEPRGKAAPQTEVSPSRVGL